MYRIAQIVCLVTRDPLVKIGKQYFFLTLTVLINLQLYKAVIYFLGNVEVSTSIFCRELGECDLLRKSLLECKCILSVTDTEQTTASLLLPIYN